MSLPSIHICLIFVLYLSDISTDNNQGIATAHNNLGATALYLKHFDASKKHFLEAIRLGEERLKNTTDPDEIQRLRRVLSDRQGNLAVAYLEAEDFGTAYNLLENLLQGDKALGYIMGCVVKQVRCHLAPCTSQPLTDVKRAYWVTTI